MPRVRALVHRIQVQGGLELGLAAREEHDAGDGRGHAAAQELEGVVGDLGRGGGLEGVGRKGDRERVSE